MIGLKPQNYENYLDNAKSVLCRAWGGARQFLGTVDAHVAQMQRIGNIAAPMISEPAGDRAGSVKSKLDTIGVQAARVRDTLEGAQKVHSRISDVVSQIY